MRFLADMGISQASAAFLRARGHNAIHLRDEGLLRLPDVDILEKARDEKFVILAHDLDFSDLVAAGSERLPSVVVFRLRDMRPANVNRHLEILLANHSDALEAGVIVSVTVRQDLPSFLLSLSIAAVLSACATSRTSVPEAVVNFPTYQFDVFRDTGVRVTVLDQRSERDSSDLLVSRLLESLRTALISNGIRINTAAEPELEVRITQLRADFELGNWQGCTRMIAVLQGAARNERIDADRCVARSNMRGYQSANEALSESFKDAIAQLLSELDAL